MTLPNGLPSYEFIRTLKPIPEVDRMLRFCEEFDSDRNPVVQPDGKVHFTPIQIEEWFGKAGPIEIEIGCGKGGFLVAYSERHPEMPLLGIEWEATIAFMAAKRIAKREQLAHTRVMLGDAFYFFRDFLPSACVANVHMYFPNPWPKKRHLKNRLLKTEFLDLVERVVLPGACFFWGTDHEAYNQDSLAILNAHPAFSILNANAEPTEGIQTNFEKKYRIEGRPIYRSVWKITPRINN